MTDTTTADKPEALRLAEKLQSNFFDGKQGREVWDAAAAELRRLQAQVSRDAEDAARYRYLRLAREWSVIDGFGRRLSGGSLDTAIDADRTRLDAARAKEGKA